jgi:hypothetical protein
MNRRWWLKILIMVAISGIGCANGTLDTPPGIILDSGVATDPSYGAAKKLAKKTAPVAGNSSIPDVDVDASGEDSGIHTTPIVDNNINPPKQDSAMQPIIVDSGSSDSGLVRFVDECKKECQLKYDMYHDGWLNCGGDGVCTHLNDPSITPDWLRSCTIGCDANGKQMCLTQCWDNCGAKQIACSEPSSARCTNLVHDCDDNCSYVVCN